MAATVAHTAPETMPTARIRVFKFPVPFDLHAAIAVEAQIRSGDGELAVIPIVQIAAGPDVPIYRHW
ncbi:hypothetical protein C5E51_35640 [Nocardia nova]|uniref:Uncharacterized protein n=1 Tax=Nocardia nova TaxID=37330 RepID=A0A2S6AFJ6_9NOCA|nr:hypothetical protein C5E51_35640 [Nocardia nova]PPJ33154.1 hypothetical protein C5F51_02410 [Nocardia nova]